MNREPLKLTAPTAPKSRRVRCDARCRNATGPICDCQCQGKHHGESWQIADDRTLDLFGETS